MAGELARIQTLIKTDFLVRLDSDVDTIITQDKIDYSARTLISIGTKTLYDSYIANTLDAFDEKTMDYALASLVISQLFFSEFDIVQGIVKATIHQYGDGKLTPASTEDIKTMSDWWVFKAKTMIKVIKTPNTSGTGLVIEKPPIWGSNDTWN